MWKLLNIMLLSKKVNVIESDYMNVMDTLKQDIIVSDPPWCVRDYMKYTRLRLHLNRKDKFKLYVLLVPYNYDIKFFIEKIKSPSIFIKKYSSLYVIFILNDKDFSSLHLNPLKSTLLANVNKT